MLLAQKGKIDLLKTVVTDPDYQAREKFLNGQSPRSLSLQEEKARALSKLAAYNKSAEIMKQIKNRLGSDESLKHYMANELAKTQTEFGQFMAQEISEGSAVEKDIRSSSIKF